MPRKFDAIVIGAGQAGPALTARMAKEGWKIAVIERHLFGGTCVNVGCTPTKALVASARAIHMARRGEEFGFTVGGDVRADFKRIMQRKNDIVAPSNKGVESWMKGTAGVTVFEGHGRLESPTTVSVGEELLEAPRIFLNVGARARVPELPGIHDVPYLTNSGILDLQSLPEHLLIVGGSYIGLEFAQIFRRFGSKVTVIEIRDRLLPSEDEQVSSSIMELLEAEGIAFRMQAECVALSAVGNAIEVGVECPVGPPSVRGSHVLLAMGRTPNTHDLGLDEAGVKAEKRGAIPVDDVCRTNVPGIWALGECNGRGGFTHTAYNDFEIVAADLFDEEPRSIARRVFCSALYTDPPLARIGMNERQVRASGRKALVAERPMIKVTRAREQSETYGFMKVWIDAETKRFLGATIFGANGDEIIHSILDAMYADAPYTAISRAVHIHPTISELIPTMLHGARPLE